MTTTTATVESTIIELEQALAALGDPGDVPLTRNAQAEFAGKQSTLRNRISTLRVYGDTLREVEPQLRELEKWHTHLTEWQSSLDAQLTSMDPRDPLRGGVELSLQRIARGLDLEHELLPARLPLDDLMAEAGYVPRDAFTRAQGDAWHGSLWEVEAKLAKLRAKRDDAHARLDGALRTAG